MSSNTMGTDIYNLVMGLTAEEKQDLEYVWQQIAAKFYKYLQVPVGSIITLATNIVPSGFAECNGAALSRIDFAELYSAIGTRWGSGNGSTTFNIPDLRGLFIRGYDHGAGNDPDAGTRTESKSGGASGDSVGSAQEDSLQGHAHSTGDTTGGPLVSSIGQGESKAGRTATLSSATNNEILTGSPVSDSINGTPRLSSETRAKNVSVMYIIKTYNI